MDCLEDQDYGMMMLEHSLGSGPGMTRGEGLIKGRKVKKQSERNKDRPVALE